MVILDIVQDIAPTAFGVGTGVAGGAGGAMAWVRWEMKQAKAEILELKAIIDNHIKKHEKDDRSIFEFISASSEKLKSIDGFMERIERKLQ